MKLELSIKDDKEMRDLIRDMIRGAVTTIIRDELKDIAAKQLSQEMDKRLREASTYEVREQLRKSGITAKQISDAIKEFVSAEVEDQIFRRAFAMLQRDNDAIEKIITEKIKGISVRIG